MTAEPVSTWYTPAEARKVLGVTAAELDKLAASDSMLQVSTVGEGADRLFDRVAVDHVAATRQ